MNARQRERVAYHEAGHAVASYLLRRAFRYVTIIPNEDCLGHVMHPEGSAGLIDPLRGEPNLRAVERAIIILLAGLTAETIQYGRRPPHWAGQSDVKKAVKLACLGADPAGDPGGPWCWIAWLLRRTRYLLQSAPAWVAVEALVPALLQSHRLSSPQVRRIIQEAWQDPDRFQAVSARQRERGRALLERLAARQSASGRP